MLKTSFGPFLIREYRTVKHKMLRVLACSCAFRTAGILVQSEAMTILPLATVSVVPTIFEQLPPSGFF